MLIFYTLHTIHILDGKDVRSFLNTIITTTNDDDMPYTYDSCDIQHS